MWSDETCPKCQSTEIIPNVRILDRLNATDFDAQDLTAVVYDNPGAFIFKGKHKSSLDACVCGRCGYTEFFARNPEELLLGHKESLAKRQQ